MADGPRGDRDRHADASRLRDLEVRIAKLTPKPKVSGPMAGHDQAHLAWRMVIEIVAGIGIGFGIGFGLDRLFGTTPFLMILFLFLGFAAGIKVMMRSAAELGSKSGLAPDPDEKRD